MRMGRVKFVIQYVVDLDNADQVELATDYVIEDAQNAVKYGEEQGYVHEVEDSSLTEADISQSILDFCFNEGDDDFISLKAQAPFTEDQVKSISEFQESPYWHPFTCGNDSCDHVTLGIARDGFFCPNCHNWKQDWAHSFMADYSWKDSQFISDLRKKFL
jgi:hypothetical protein